MSKKLYVGRPNLGDRELMMLRINKVLDSKWLSNNGPFVQALEAELKNLINSSHCIPVTNATVGLTVAMLALGLDKGEVIIPSFTFIATANAVSAAGLTPVFCDVDLDTHLMNINHLHSLINEKTVAIMPVHIWGNVCNVENVDGIAKQHGLKVIYDAAHALGSSHKGTMVGNFGDCEVFSLHATKFINSIEGGFISTNNNELASKLRALINFGIENNEIVYQGFNAKMHEISAAIGLTNLESIWSVIQTNYLNYFDYKSSLQYTPGIKLYSHSEDVKDLRNYQYVVIEVTPKAKVNRDELLKHLEVNGVIARKYFHPACHQAKPYLQHSLHLKNSETLASRCISLPTGTAIASADVKRVCNLITEVV